MTVSEADRLSVFELRQRGLPVREIAAQIGVSKNTVSSILKAGLVPKISPESVPKIDAPSHARARATEKVSQKSEENWDKKLGQCPKKIGTRIGTEPKVQIISPKTITRGLTISELFDLLTEAKDTLQRAKQPDEDGNHDVKAEVAAINAVKAILTQMGEWCGLDDTLTGESEKDSIGVEDVDRMSLDEMRALVARL